MPNRKQPSRLTWNYKPFQALESRFQVIEKFRAKRENLQKLLKNIQAIELPNKNRVRRGKKNSMIKELQSRLNVPAPMKIGFSGGVGQRSRQSTAAHGRFEASLAKKRYPRELGFGTLV
jgi:hypothetical protein